MKTKMKTVKTAMMAAALALMTATFAYADTNPANDSGAFTVRLVPNVDLGVLVDTTGANWNGEANLDVTMDLGTEMYMENPVGIAMAGNFTKQELTLTGVALNTWQLDTDELGGVDRLALYALFGLDSFVSSPDNSDYDGVSNLIVSTPRRAGQPQVDENTVSDSNKSYELLDAHAEFNDVDDIDPSDTFSLWLRARTPASSTTDQQAAFTVIVTAVTGAGQ